MHRNIAMKFAGDMARILLCKHCKFSDKISYNSRDIKFFPGDYFFIGAPCTSTDNDNIPESAEVCRALWAYTASLARSWLFSTVTRRTTTRSCWTRKRALHVYSPGVVASGICGQCVMARCCCCARCCLLLLQRCCCEAIY